MTPTLHTQRLTLRRPTPRDWPAFRDFMMSARSLSLGSDRHEGRAWRTFASELGHWEIHGYGMWAVTLRDADTALALIGPWTPVDWPETEVGWMVLSAEVEGTGIAREAAEAAITHAYRDLGWATVVSYIAPDNARSIALAERLGAVCDPQAPRPDRFPETLVYRHPAPGAAT